MFAKYKFHFFSLNLQHTNLTEKKLTTVTISLHACMFTTNSINAIFLLRFGHGETHYNRMTIITIQHDGVLELPTYVLFTRQTFININTSLVRVQKVSSQIFSNQNPMNGRDS